MKLKFVLLSLICACAINLSGCHCESGSKYLVKPTGQYSVGFEDFHWIDQKRCPDFNFNGKNLDDFSSENTKHCHEIIARIYYPTEATNKSGSSYYAPLVRSLLGQFTSFSPATEKELQQWRETRSYTIEKAPIIANEKFPVLFFNPGFGCPVEQYENFIINLVSHGYIVIGINTPFINPVALPNGRIVKHAYISSQEKAAKEYYPLQLQDLAYVFAQVNVLKNSSSVFTAMDLKHVGAFGHSVGAKTVADITHAHPAWFQAAATLDLCGGKSDPGNIAHKKFDIPFLHLIAADNVARERGLVIRFDLGNHNYLIGISPEEKNHEYSLHMNFADDSTLQYAPAYQADFDYLQKHPGGEKFWLGSGNGWEITESVNTYLLKFFDMYLKNETAPEFKQCKTLTKNTYVKCGDATTKVIFLH